MVPERIWENAYAYRYAVSQLLGDALNFERSKRHFRYAYASNDGYFVAIVSRDMITYIVDVYEQRYYVECGGLPCGFFGHILEMDQVSATQTNSVPGRSSLTAFDLDMNDSEIQWRNCPDCAI